MDAVTLLNQARSAGLSLTVKGGSLKVVGPKSAAALVRELAGCKAELVHLLTVEHTDGGSLGASGAPLPGERLSLFRACYADAEPDDEGRYALDERAAIYEFDGGLSRGEAEEMAAREWLARAEPAGGWTN